MSQMGAQITWLFALTEFSSAVAAPAYRWSMPITLQTITVSSYVADADSHSIAVQNEADGGKRSRGLQEYIQI